MDTSEYIDAGLVHAVHTSERRSFRGCRRRWAWVFRDMYYPYITARPLEFGVAYHVAMETYYNPTTWPLVLNPATREQIVNSAIMAFETTNRAQLQKYRDNVGEPTPELLDDYNDRTELGRGMLLYHLNEVAPELDKSIRPVKVEIEFMVPIEDEQGNGIWCKCDVCFSRWARSPLKAQALVECTEYLREAGHDQDYIDAYHSTEEDVRGHFEGLPVVYGGRIDALMEEVDSPGSYWIFDWKTAANLSDRKDYLLLDDQISSYVWAFWKLGVNVKGFIYHEQKKAYPKEPEPMKVTRLGRMYSVSKNLETSAELYRRTVAENDTAAYESGLYDEFIQYLEEEGVMYYGRYEVHRNETELRNIGRYLFDECADMTNPDLRIYPMPGRFSCGNCAFQTPCLGKTMGEDFQYTLDTLFEKRTKHYWEEAPPSTEEQGRAAG